jgi:hypothetical protein
MGSSMNFVLAHMDIAVKDISGMKWPIFNDQMAERQKCR